MPDDDLFMAIDHFLERRPFYACLLLVHLEINRLQAAADTLLSNYDWPSLSVGATLSQALRPEPARRRSRQAQRSFNSFIKSQAPGPVLCTDIDLLFEPGLSFDPLHLIREASRQTRIVVIWPGSFTRGVLAYAVKEHDLYQTWTQTELGEDQIITL